MVAVRIGIWGVLVVGDGSSVLLGGGDEECVMELPVVERYGGEMERWREGERWWAGADNHFS